MYSISVFYYVDFKNYLQDKSYTSIGSLANLLNKSQTFCPYFTVGLAFSIQYNYMGIFYHSLLDIYKKSYKYLKNTFTYFISLYYL